MQPRKNLTAATRCRRCVLLLLAVATVLLTALQSLATQAAATDDWGRTVAAAKKEGTVVIWATSGELLRQVLMEFEHDYPGIKVAYESGNSRNFWPRLEKERGLGRYLWDLSIGGVSKAFDARDRGFLDPIRPLLTLPEVTDDSKWLGGIDGLYADREKKYAMRFIGSQFAAVMVDRDAVSAKEFNSARDLLDPRWRGKIVMQDPRGGGGAGAYALAGFLLQYGEPFVRELLTAQQVVISDNKRQMAEWVIRKRYPIAIGMGTETLPQFHQQGLGLNVRVVPGDIVTGDAVLLINKAPHPNAAKVYANWLFSRKTQARLAEVARFNSRRTDVKPGNPALALDPRRAQAYHDLSSEEYLAVRLRARQLAMELLK